MRIPVKFVNDIQTSITETAINKRNNSLITTPASASALTILPGAFLISGSRNSR